MSKPRGHMRYARNLLDGGACHCSVESARRHTATSRTLLKDAWDRGVPFPVEAIRMERESRNEHYRNKKRVG